MALHGYTCSTNRKDAMNPQQNDLDVAILNGEIRVQMPTWMCGKGNPSTARMAIDIGYGRTQYITVHNVPVGILNKTLMDGRALRSLVIDTGFGTDCKTYVKRINLNGTDYAVTSTTRQHITT